MMKYLYQDSVKLPNDRDFIHDLETLLDVTAAVVPLEGEIISANKEVEESHRAKDMKIAGLKTFESNVTMHLNELVMEWRHRRDTSLQECNHRGMCILRRSAEGKGRF